MKHILTILIITLLTLTCAKAQTLEDFEYRVNRFLISKLLDLIWVTK